MNQNLFESVNSTSDSTFGKIFELLQKFYYLILDPHTWGVLQIISSLATLLFIGIIIFSLVRLFELQTEENTHLDHEIHEALEKQKEHERNINPRWHYILTLIESPNESDWRVAIIESDSMMEEALREKGLSGETASELLEAATSSGYRSISQVWESHRIRNEIAHSGINFPLSQIEGRRVIRMYQNFFEELGII
jgi:hypothetical protein